MITSEQFLILQSLISAIAEQPCVKERAQEIYTDLKAKGTDYSGQPIIDVLRQVAGDIKSGWKHE